MPCIIYTSLLFVYFLSYSSCIQAETMQSTPPINNFAPIYHYDPKVTSEVHPHFTTELNPNIIINTSSALSLKISDLSIQFIQNIKDTITRQNYHSFKHLIATMLWQYRYTLAGATLIGSYSITTLFLATDYYIHLHNHQLWARWKPEYTFEQLCTMSPKHLTQELLTAINEVNYNKNNPTDFNHPLILFLTTIDKEITICKRYIIMAQYIKRLHLMKIFPINDNKINEVNELLQRALFIKHLFLSWLSDYNLNNSRR